MAFNLELEARCDPRSNIIFGDHNHVALDEVWMIFGEFRDFGKAPPKERPVGHLAT
jgi:hypothetical protein